MSDRSNEMSPGRDFLSTGFYEVPDSADSVCHSTGSNPLPGRGHAMSIERDGLPGRPDILSNQTDPMSGGKDSLSGRADSLPGSVYGLPTGSDRDRLPTRTDAVSQG